MRKLGFSGAWSVRIGLALVALILALSAEWLRPGSVVRLDEGLRDYFVRWSADTSPEDRVVVIDIGEAALQEAGPWPWPRARIADLVEILLGTYQARAVGLDIVFSEPADADGDARLAALAAHAPLALAQIFDYVPRIPAMSLGRVGGGVTQSSGPSVQAQGFIANHSGLAGARCVGNIGYLPDADGVLRRIPELTRFGGKDYSHLSSALLNCAADTVAAALQPVGLGLGDKDGFWRVPYSRAQNAYTVVSAADILYERAPPELLAGRFVLVGSSSLGLGDRVSTPLAPLSSGVMVHAASLTGLLDLAQGRASAPTSGRQLLLAWCLISIAVASFFIARLSVWASLPLLLGLVACWLGLAFMGVARQAEWSVTAPLWAYFFLLLVAIPNEWWQSQRRTRRLLNTFSHYVAQPVLDEIVRRGLNYSLTPTLCDVTVLIADMEGYTRMTSSLSLEEAAGLTKDFLGCLTRPVLTWCGTLDKYTGDGLVAFWGAPLACPEQADWAVSAALDILAEVDAFNAERQRSGIPPVRVRIGIESGRALVGDLGTSFRSTYTAVGDCINFASRLESAARDLPTQLVIGAATNGLLQRHTTRSLGKITLRGTQTSIDVFTV
ncbi:CHASE2 domain-containing protein [Rhodoferax antarcticus]|uniref:CHASE2 domain-containing protein n=1 Tax=Rhodoferax antarcticus TaxID=81479 RepID=UPI00222553EA|nr:adenylate/guanylate cyclase domain-containing protein [Rhodoferax antarcticus]MCW2313977.1 adenylate cyclase [Rhodoferax antarcticus]